MVFKKDKKPKVETPKEVKYEDRPIEEKHLDVPERQEGETQYEYNQRVSPQHQIIR